MLGGRLKYSVNLDGRRIPISFSRRSPSHFSLFPPPCSSRPGASIKVKVDGVKIHESKSDWDMTHPDIANFHHEGHQFILRQIGADGCKRLALIVDGRLSRGALTITREGRMFCSRRKAHATWLEIFPVAAWPVT